MTVDATSVELERLLEYLLHTRGFDFGAYKRSSLARRIRKRMEMVAVEDYPAYIDYLEVHPDEFTHLFNTILINVTGFFRDPVAWEFLSTEVIPPLLARTSVGPIRLWSAGCASGEEPYSLAMLFAEAMGMEAYRERVKIYTTDVDEEALAQARQATHDAASLEAVPPELREKYFEPVNGRFLFHKELRCSVIFGRHDLIQDAPISRIDLLVCRNTLMYFNAEAQARIVARFHFALNESGVLFLGKAETLLTHNTSFAALSLKNRIFVKVQRAGARERLLLAANPGDGVHGALANHVKLRDAAADAVPLAQLVFSLSGTLIHANQSARQLFRLGSQDLGRPLQDLELSYRPVELRSCIDRAYAEEVPISIKDVEWQAGPGEVSSYDVQVVPLVDPAGASLGVSVTFVDITRYKRLQGELQRSNQELETALEELQSTNEELETTNEELQSTVEELETTNEELQSTNEELETMNEELQSTNEELSAINDEVRRRSDELNSVNFFLESILTTLQSGVIVLDREFKVHVWSQRSEDLWGLRSDEVLGKNFLNLDIGLPVERLRQPIRACLSGDPTDGKPVQVAAVNRRGKKVNIKISCTQIRLDGGESGAILLVDESGAEGD